MAIPLTVNGAVFEYPVDFDENWGVDATGWAQAVTNGMLQMQGGSFPLTANVNFGPNFGLLSQYFQTRSASPATTGTVRLSSADAGVAWRNNANSANLVLTTNASDQLLYNGTPIAGVGAGVTSITGTANQIIASASTGAITLSAPQDIAPASTPSFFATTLTATATQLVLGTGNVIGLSAPTPAANRLYIIPDIGTASASFVMTEGPQTINGVKTFSTPTAVDSGGTGNTTFTAYSVITAGTTPTGAFQNVSGLGLSGQALTSNGAGLLPTWQNVAGSGTVNTGTATHLAYYATSTNAVSDASGATISGTYTYSGLPTFTGGLTVSAGTTTLTTGATSAANIAMGGNKITGLAQGTVSGDAVAFPVASAQISSDTVTGSTANSGGAAGNIDQGTISTPDFRANAVTQNQISATGSVVANTSITSKTITTIGGPVFIVATGEILGTSALVLGLNQVILQVSVDRDGNSIPGATTTLFVRGLTAAGENQTFSGTVVAIDSPSAGTYTYNFNYANGGGFTTVSRYSLNLVELRA